MIYRVRFKSAAAKDIEMVKRWYSAKRDELGDEFVAAIDNAVAAIAEHPARYMVVRGNRVRRYLVHRFPYRVYYLFENDEVVVIACLHNKRSPARLTARITRET